MRYPTPQEIQELSVADRLQLLEEVWETLANHEAALPMTEGHKQEIDRRLEEWHKTGENGATWQQVRKRIEKAE
jgi:putative addiction module component (TIGR02574 family)